MNRVKTQGNPVVKFLDESTSYPYLKSDLGRDISGISVTNDHASDTVTLVVIANGVTHTFNVLAGKTFTEDFEDITSINTTAGTTFQIALRGI